MTDDQDLFYATFEQTVAMFAVASLAYLANLIRNGEPIGAEGCKALFEPLLKETTAVEERASMLLVANAINYLPLRGVGKADDDASFILFDQNIGLYFHPEKGWSAFRTNDIKRFEGDGVEVVRDTFHLGSLIAGFVGREDEEEA